MKLIAVIGTVLTLTFDSGLAQTKDALAAPDSKKESSKIQFADPVYDFGKVVVYFLLLLCNVTNPRRIRQFLGWLVVFIVVLTAIAIHQYWTIPDLTMHRYTVVDKNTGLELNKYRLQSKGVFNDPNDLCLILTLGMAVCLYRFADRKAGLLRPSSGRRGRWRSTSTTGQTCAG